MTGLPEETKIEKDTRAPVFTAAPFATATTRKQPGRASTDGWVKKLWYTSREYYSALKRNTSESVLTRWMNLGTFIRSEVSQKERNKYHILTHNMESRDGMDEHLQGSSRHRERTNLWTRLGGREERLGQTESVEWKLTLWYVK